MRTHNKIVSGAILLISIAASTAFAFTPFTATEVLTASGLNAALNSVPAGNLVGGTLAAGIQNSSLTSAASGVFGTGAYAPQYVLPVGSSSVLGGVKPDGTTILISGSGVISAPSGAGTVTSVSAVNANNFSWSVTNPNTSPVLTLTQGAATSSVLGAVRPDGTTITVTASGVITAVTGGSGTVTTSGSPSGGNLSKFSGATAITNGDLSGDVTTSGTLATTVSGVGGASAANIATATTAANAATSNNTVSTIVKRDSSGNFSAGTITANLTGTASLSSAVTNATLTTSLTNNGGAGTLNWPAAGATLIIPSGGGTLSSGAFAAIYSLPAATSSTLGGVKPDGTTLTNSTGAISVTYGTSTNTAAQGNDSRIVSAVQPSTAPVLTGTNFSGTAASLTAGNATAATTATNLSGGAASSVPYQTAAGATSFFAGLANAVVAYSSVGTPSASVTLPANLSIANPSSGLAASAIGYLGIPQNVVSGVAYTTAIGDAGHEDFHPAADNAQRTFTIDSNANVPYPIGTCLTFTNLAATSQLIAITSDTMYLLGAGTTGTRTLAQYGKATACKETSTIWTISGINLTFNDVGMGWKIDVGNDANFDKRVRV